MGADPYHHSFVIIFVHTACWPGPAFGPDRCGRPEAVSNGPQPHEWAGAWRGASSREPPAPAASPKPLSVSTRPVDARGWPFEPRQLAGWINT